MAKKLNDLSPMERLQRSIEALGDAAHDESEASRARAAVQALSGVLLKAISKGASHEVIVTLVVDEIGVSRRVAANALRPFFKSNKSEVLPDTQAHAEKPKPEIQALPAGATRESPPAPPTVARDENKAHPALPPDLMPKDGQMPPTPMEGEYRIEHRPGGAKVYVMHGNTYSLLPGIDPTAPFGRYVDGRPMNEWGSPIGEGPPVIHGTNFIGENHQE